MILLPPAIQAPAPAPASVVKVVAQVSASSGQVRLGSGVVIAPGIVATNAHVTHGGGELSIQAAGRTWAARVRNLDPMRDLALLTVPGLDLPAAQFSEETPKEGQSVSAWGYPKGTALRRSEGSIALVWSFLGSPLLQAELEAAPGSSGGGLFDAQGRLAGLTTFVLNRHPKAAFAVPVEWIQSLLGTAPGEGATAAGDEIRLMREFLARMMSEPGNLPGWLRLTARWTKEAPEDPEAWSARALALMLDLALQDAPDPKERLAAASATERALTQALALDPASPQAWRSLGQVLDLQGRYGEAEIAYQEALRKNPEDGGAWEGLGVVRLNLRQMEPGRAALGTAVRLVPDNARAWALLAHAEAELKRWTEAQDHYRIAVGLAPFRAAWLQAWGLTALKNKDRATAQAALARLDALQSGEAKDLRKALGTP